MIHIPSPTHTVLLPWYLAKPTCTCDPIPILVRTDVYVFRNLVIFLTLQVLHDAIDRIVTPQPPSDLPLVSCTCGEPDTARVCLCGLEDYISGAHNELELSVDNWDWVVEL